MAFQPGPNMVEILINQELHQQRVQNSLYAIKDSPWDGATLELLAGEIITWVGDTLYGPLSVNLSLTEVVCTALDTPNSPTFTGVPTVGTYGLDTGPALPGNCAFVISFRSGLSGRSARGRNYIAGLPESAVAANQVATLVAQELVAAYAALPALFQQFGSLHVIASRYTGGALRSSVYGYAVLSYIAADLYMDSQRRRLTKRGS